VTGGGAGAARALAAPVGLALLVVAGSAALAAAVGLAGAAGPDAPIWGLTAADLASGGRWPLAPPGYPALVALVRGLGLGRPDLALPDAGRLVSTAAAAAVPAVVWAGARAGGAGMGAAAAAAAVAIAGADLLPAALQLQPDTLTAALVAAAGAGLLRGSAGGHGLAAAAALALPFVREPGLAVAAVVAGALLLRRAWGPLAVLGLGLLLGAWAAGGAPADWPWAHRAGAPFAALLDPRRADLSPTGELDAPARAAYAAAAAAGDRAALLRVHLARALRSAPEAWLTLGGALVVGLRRPGTRAAAAVLLVALPALLVWSQRRHPLLFVPLALAVLASAAPPWVRRACLGALLLGAGLRAPAWVDGLRGEAARAAELRALAAWIEAEAPPGSLLGGRFQDLGLYAPLARHDPDGSDTDWSVLLVDDRRPSRDPRGPWQRVFQGPGSLAIFRLDPSRSPRPCAGVLPPRTAPRLVVGPARVTLVCGP
jgi:hypothetical protein